MTDRYFAVTVLFEKDIREDDLEHYLNAIRMIRGVQKVEPHVSDPELWAAKERARYKLEQELRNAIWPKS